VRRRFCVALFVAALAGGGAQAAGKSHTVRIEGMKFVPEQLQVAAGDTITWTNGDVVPHTVTSAERKVESGDIATGKSWKLKVTKKGDMPYICRLHPGMKGAVVVK
jgi:plastocyanin